MKSSLLKAFFELNLDDLMEQKALASALPFDAEVLIRLWELERLFILVLFENGPTYSIRVGVMTFERECL